MADTVVDRELLADRYGDELLFMDETEFDACILGVASRCGMEPVVVYDRACLVGKFMDQGMTAEDAEEWVSYNVTGAYVGERTPMYLDRIDDDAA